MREGYDKGKSTIIVDLDKMGYARCLVNKIRKYCFLK